MEQHAENVLAASMMAQSLSCCLEKKYLDSLTANNSLIEIVNNGVGRSIFKHISWLKVTQIGKPINHGVTSCFSYIQKILMSCALPNTQLTFLVLGDGVKCNLYLGLRDNGNENSIMTQTVANLNNFAKVCWPGLQTIQFDEEDTEINKHFDTEYNYITAVTGIPSLPDTDNSAITTIEHLIGGMHNQKFAYLVTASPVGSERIDDILGQCRDMQGILESAKSCNISTSVQNGYSYAYGKSHSEFTNWSTSDAVSKRDYKSSAGYAMLGAGLYMAAGLFFPPAMAILPGLGTAFTGAMLSSNPMATFLGLSGMSGMNILSGFVPQNTHTETHGGGFSDTISETETTSHSTSETISKTLINKHVEAACKQLETYVKRFDLAKATGAWDVSCLLFSESPSSSASWQLKSLLSGSESSLEPIRIHDVTSIMPRKGTAKASSLMIKFKEGDLFHHPFGEDFSQLKSMLTTRELSALVNFPLHSVPGINVVDSAPEFSLSPQTGKGGENILNVGRLLYGGTPSSIEVRLPIDTLSRHALVCGVNGSGKTNTVLSVLDGFSKAGRPFFVIEPAKTEYVDWAIEVNKRIKDPKKKIKIFIPGCERYAKANFIPEKLRINPFEVIQLPNSEMRVLSHIDRLKSTFASAFPMQDILPVIIEHLLYDLYTNKHQMLEKDDWTNYMKNGVPTLTDIGIDYIEKFMKEIGYAKENTQNITAALRTRFQSLRQGWKKELLENEKLNYSWEEFFGSPVVVNLSYAGDDQDRAFIMSLLLQFLYEYRIAESESEKFSFNANECRHLVVVEEAHRVMGRCDNPEAPQYRSGLMFSNFLSEVRAYGQGMMVVDQVPTRLIEDAIKNTNIKIIHKLVASDDSRIVAECIGLTADQQRVIPKLSIGQAVLAGFNSANVMSSDSSDIYLAQINKMK
ncbi:MAG: ATP-binding protein [Bacteroidaceae bacterium]|nr:ATP-binding protein [Bacteroidaceae bacterium]MBP3552593.1 ATP-binding protein [Bacteroidaceae bacterium]